MYCTVTHTQQLMLNRAGIKPETGVNTTFRDSLIHCGTFPAKEGAFFILSRATQSLKITRQMTEIIK